MRTTTGRTLKQTQPTSCGLYLKKPDSSLSRKSLTLRKRLSRQEAAQSMMSRPVAVHQELARFSKPATTTRTCLQVGYTSFKQSLRISTFLIVLIQSLIYQQWTLTIQINIPLIQRISQRAVSLLTATSFCENTKGCETLPSTLLPFTQPIVIFYLYSLLYS